MRNLSCRLVKHRSPKLPGQLPRAREDDVLNAGDTAWVLAGAALVMLMTPGLAFFYGGMVRAKSVLNMLMMNFICIAVVTVAWVLYGWSVSFGNANDASGSGFWGGLHQWGMHSISTGITGSPGIYG